MFALLALGTAQACSAADKIINPGDDEISKSTLVVVVSGLPSGLPANISVNGPGVAKHLTTTGAITVPTEGTYIVGAGPVLGTDKDYVPDYETSSVHLYAAEVDTAWVQYSVLTTGAMSLSAGGLPSGVEAGWQLKAAEGGLADWGSVIGQDTVWNIDPGSYTVFWQNVTADAYGGPSTFAPDPAVHSVTFEARYAPVALSTTYHLITGGIRLSVTGLPEGMRAAWNLADSKGDCLYCYFYQELLTDAADTVTDLTPDVYTLTWDSIEVTTASGIETYVPSSDEEIRQVTVTASPTPVEAPVSYHLATGDLDVTVSGLPLGSGADWELRDQASDRLVNSGRAGAATTSHYSNIPPGDYTLTFDSEYSGGVTYSPTSAIRQVTITVGTTAAVSVLYQ